MDAKDLRIKANGLADIAAQTLVAPQELATGAMTALVGAPLFIFIAARFFK